MHHPRSISKIAIAIPVHSRRETTLACLSCMKKVKKDGFHFDIIVVNDGSSAVQRIIEHEIPIKSVVDIGALDGRVER